MYNQDLNYDLPFQNLGKNHILNTPKSKTPIKNKGMVQVHFPFPKRKTTSKYVFRHPSLKIVLSKNQKIQTSFFKDQGIKSKIVIPVGDDPMKFKPKTLVLPAAEQFIRKL